jgi:predicted GH43/DUF377 family glycosyl hydrolase
MEAERTGIILKPDHRRVLFLPFRPISEAQTLKIVARIMSLTEEETRQEIKNVFDEFGNRHQKLQDYFLKRFDQIREYTITDKPNSEERKMLIGSYFTQEYSLESSALFNPSIVWHPDQSNLPKNHRRFILSLRAVGEGHMSSIVFRSGTIDIQNKIKIDSCEPFVTTPEIHTNPSYEKFLFEQKLNELNLLNEFAKLVMDSLGDTFSLQELKQNITNTIRQNHRRNVQNETAVEGILSLAQSNYELDFTLDQYLSERIIYPSTPAEINGIEDARFVKFFEDDGSYTYYATYTAFDGKVVLPQVLQTDDFLHFKINTLNGPEIQNKGLALFPRKINDQYAMISRQDNENLYIMYSDNIHFWYSKEILLKPTHTWELVQLGNCGSPIETEAGWLVLTHGVGPMRKYSIGAFLLDINDPSKVIGRLKTPLLSPNENEREGYVPNVVYTCGSLVNGDELIIPYALSDYATSFAKVKLKELLNELTS